MGESGGFNGEIDVPGGSFSRLLLSPTDTPPLFSSDTPKMLCFGDFGSHFPPSFPPHPTTTSTSTLRLLNNKRRSGSGQETGSGDVQKNGRKKNKPEVGPITTTTTSFVGHAKGRREKLGERIATLQQLVCPYGKTDTASVLHEALGYIRFLQDQVKVLSSPYLQNMPCSSSPQHRLSLTEKRAPSSPKPYETAKCLRSRGLCLVPVESIVDVGNSNGADFWSSATSLPAP